MVRVSAKGTAALLADCGSGAMTAGGVADAGSLGCAGAGAGSGAGFFLRKKLNIVNEIL